MPQIFQVLRCLKCLVFQVHQTKKSNKFKCKLCGENQSMKRHYGIGTAKDCRLHVQKLNGIRQEIDELNSSIISDSEQEDPIEEKQLKPIAPKRSKWSEYAEIDEAISKETKKVECHEDMMLNGKEVVLEVPKKKFKRPPPSKLIDNSSLYIENTQTEVIQFKNKPNLFENKHEPHEPMKNTQIEYPIKPKDVNISKFVPLPIPKVDRNISEENPTKSSFQSCNRPSKWAQFVENQIDDEESENELVHSQNVGIDNEESENELEHSQNVESHKDLNNLFSLSENYDVLNELLDF